MKIEQTRIRNTNKLLSDIEVDTLFLIGVNMNEDINLIMKEKLDIKSMNPGTKFFPEPSLGIMNRRNSVGEEIINKTKKKEQYLVPLNWSLNDWGGKAHSGTSYVTKLRHHRDFIEPKEFKLLITEKENKEKTIKEKIIVVDKSFRNNQSDFEEIKFAANLLLEIFQQVETFKIENDEKIVDSTTIHTVNWEILPPGERIWEALIQGTSENISHSERILMRERFDFIESYNPTKVYKGIGGYTNYVVFEFNETSTYIVESIIYGNATYIFKDEWENVSKLTKREILHNNLAEDRIIHNNSWQSKMSKYLSKDVI